MKAATKRRYCMHDQLSIFYDSMSLCKKKSGFKLYFIQFFGWKTSPVHCINGKSPFPKPDDFQEQHFPCPTGGYTAVNSRSKTPSPQTGPAWDFSVNGTASLWPWGNLICCFNPGLTVNNLAAIKICNFLSFHLKW